MVDKQKFVWNQWQLLAKLGFRGKGLRVFPLILGSGGGGGATFKVWVLADVSSSR